MFNKILKASLVFIPLFITAAFAQVSDATFRAVVGKKLS